MGARLAVDLLAAERANNAAIERLDEGGAEERGK